MTYPSKGFDPLASLFDPPPRFPAMADAPDDEDDFDAGLMGGDMGDEAASEGALLDVPEPAGLFAAEPEYTPTEPVIPPAPTADEKAELAKKLALEAMARVAPPTPAPVISEAEKAELAKRLVAEAMAKRAPPPVSDAEKLELAKKLAAKAKAAVAPSPAPAVPKAPAAPKARPTLAARAKRPLSALEAARLAAEREERRAEQRGVNENKALMDRLADLLRRQLGGAGLLDVQNAVLLDDRTLLRALWKGHRARFASEGKLDQVVSVTNVIRALDAVASGQLAAAIARTAGTDYLVFVDLGSQATIAAFPDARAWYSGLGKS